MLFDVEHIEQHTSDYVWSTSAKCRIPRGFSVSGPRTRVIAQTHNKELSRKPIKIQHGVLVCSTANIHPA